MKKSLHSGLIHGRSVLHADVVESVAMQKVVGSSPIIRFEKAPEI